MKTSKTNQLNRCGASALRRPSASFFGGTERRGYPSAQNASADDMLKLAAHLFGTGKLSLKLSELAAATSFSKRTIRRAEIKGQLVALKLTRTKSFLISDVLDWLQRIR